MTHCRNFFPINDKNFIYIEGSETRVEGWRRVIYIAKMKPLAPPSADGRGGVYKIEDLQAIPKHVYIDLMRKVEQAIDDPGACVKVCQDFHIETSVGEQSSLHLDIFSGRDDAITLNHDDMLALRSFQNIIFSTLDAPLSEHRCDCRSMHLFTFYQCHQQSILDKENDNPDI